MAKIYTRTGDDGTTALANGKRVKKTADIIAVFGSLDELNAFLGFAAEALYTKNELQDLLKHIYQIQKDLFELGGKLASGNKFTLDPEKVARFEAEIDAMTEKLPIAKSFILPGGGEISARLHIARTVCRRAERETFKLFATDILAETVGIYLNRLSDWLYVAARYVAFVTNVEELTFKTG